MVDKRYVKITVMKKLGIKELWGEDAPASGAEDLCPRFQLGEVYTVEAYQMPKDWPCSWAWHLQGSTSPIIGGGSSSLNLEISSTHVAQTE